MVFYLCARCDHGQRYCSDRCRQKARRQQQRAANRRHQQSPEGRLDHRDRQREYRRRRQAARVTDQRSQPGAACASIQAPANRLRAALVVSLPPWFSRPGPPPLLRCWRCGRLGSWVNPFAGENDP